MSEWRQLVQTLIDETDACIRKRESDLLTLSALSRKLGYSEDTLSRKFKEISGMHFRDYLRQRSLAFALKEVRDSKKGFWRLHWTMAFPATKPSPVPLRKPTA